MLVPLPLSTDRQVYGQESAGRLVNAYAEPKEKTAGVDAIYRRVPGLLEFADTGEEGFRGAIEVSGNIRAVFEDVAVQITTGGVVTTIGTLNGTDKVFLAKNNNITPQVVAVSPNSGPFEITNVAVVAYPDPDVGSPNSVCFLGGYFFFTYGDGTARSSGLNTTAINTLDVITAESDPDGLLRGIPFRDQLLLFGPNSMEVWSGTPVNETGFPFNRVTSTPYGLRGRYAIAGHEAGAGTDLAWVGKDNAVYQLRGGYEPSKISPPWLDTLIAAVTDDDELEASVYTFAGRLMWVLKSAAWTVEFCMTTQKWNERASGFFDENAGPWRGVAPFFAFNKWLCGDTESGMVAQITQAARTELGDPLRMRVESGLISKFPAQARVAEISVNITVGVGIAPGEQPNQTDPKVEIAYALDAQTFGSPQIRPIGPQGRTEYRVTAYRFGHSRPGGGRVRIDISDDVHTGVKSVDMVAA